MVVSILLGVSILYVNYDTISRVLYGGKSLCPAELKGFR